MGKSRKVEPALRSLCPQFCSLLTASACSCLLRAKLAPELTRTDQGSPGPAAVPRRCARCCSISSLNCLNLLAHPHYCSPSPSLHPPFHLLTLILNHYLAPVWRKILSGLSPRSPSAPSVLSAFLFALHPVPSCQSHH